MTDPGFIQSVGALGYLVAGLLFAVLALLMLFAWLFRRAGGLWLVAAFVSAVWGLVLSAQVAGMAIPPEIVFLVETLRAGAWITFLAQLLFRSGGSGAIRAVSIAAWLLVLAAGLAPGDGLVSDRAAVVTYGGLMLALTGLVLLEQIYRNSPPENRRSLKPLVLGVGGIFAFDLFLYSQTALFGAIDATSWLARGAVSVGFVPAVALAARRNPTSSIDIFVSRQVVFYSTTLVAVGIYLVAMSFGGYLLIHFGGSWGSFARVIFFAGAIVVLIALMFSSSLRARSRVFLSKHFFTNKYDYREEWLRLVSTLSDFEDKSTRENAIEALAQIVDSPGGALWYLDQADEQFQLVASAGDVKAMPDLEKGDELVGFIEKDGWLVDLHEYRRDPGVYGSLDLPAWLTDTEGAWLIIPLMLGNRLVGMVLLLNAPHTPELNFEDRDLLKTVGSHVAVHLMQQRSDELLSEAQQFEAYNRLTAFLMHDLNNLIAQQSLIVANSEQHKRNPEFVDDAMKAIAASVDRMKRVMAQLRRTESGAQKNSCNIKFLASSAVDRCQSGAPVPEFESNGVEGLVEVESEQCITVLTHLIKNAQDATPNEGRVTVRLLETEDTVEVVIVDSGEGMTERFIRNRLFRPFDSTKGARGMGIGAYQAREFARDSGGDIVVSSQPGVETMVRLSLPKASPA